jgi:flagellar biosynthesis protein FliQ
MDQVSTVLEPVKYFTGQLAYFLPQLLMAVVVLVAGWLMAKLLYSMVVRSLKALNFGKLTHKAGIDTFLEHGDIKRTTGEIIGLLIYWIVILITLLVASNIVGLTAVSDLFSDILQFVPKVIVAVLILTIGLYFARFISEIVHAYSLNVGFEDADLVARLARYAIITFVIIISLEQMDIGTTIPSSAFLILFGGVVFALALMFGLGGVKWAESQFEKMASRTQGKSVSDSSAAKTTKKISKKSQ